MTRQNTFQTRKDVLKTVYRSNNLHIALSFYLLFISIFFIIFMFLLCISLLDYNNVDFLIGIGIAILIAQISIIIWFSWKYVLQIVKYIVIFCKLAKDTSLRSWFYYFKPILTIVSYILLFSAVIILDFFGIVPNSVNLPFFFLVTSTSVFTLIGVFLTFVNTWVLTNKKLKQIARQEETNEVTNQDDNL